MGSRIRRFTLEGVPGAEVSVHPFHTEDGLALNLTRFRRGDCDDVVLLVHGLTSSSDMFIMPEHRNLATFLLDNGLTDVWTVDFRMSGRFPYDTETHRFTLDDVAKYDHPAALAELRRHIGDRRLHVIVHCLGSVSFMMSMSAGLVDGVTSVVSNSVSLMPRVPRWSRLKLAAAPTLSEYVLGLSFVDPRYGEAPIFTRGWMLSRLVSLFHNECDQRACHMLSFMWGSGKPAVYGHDKLDPVTHDRIADLFGAVGVHYYRHIFKMVRAGRAVRYDDRLPDLPGDYLRDGKQIRTPVLFMTGDANKVFADSNIAAYRRLEAVRPGLHELEVVPGYGHQDTIMGKDAAVDVFPRMLDFLKRRAA